MENQNESQTRTCLAPPKGCGETKPKKSFYKTVDLCRACVFKATGYVQPTGPRHIENVELKAERHRQEKILREELKKLAKQRLYKKKAAKQRKKRDKIEKPLESLGPQIISDPATIELARRELARRKLIEFIKRFKPAYRAGWVHSDICRRLEKFSADVAAERSPRLMLLMPPRHGKSEIVSRAYPAWHLGHNPSHEFIGCSYNLALAMSFSRKVRDIIASPDYAKLFPGTTLDPGSRAAETWTLAGGLSAGGFNAAGVDGGITGKGAHILSIDDPFKGIDEADNIEHREKVWDWYVTEAYTRLAPGGGVLIIQTWWHDDDLVGRIQQTMKDADADDPYVDRFEIVRYPAIAEEDENFRLKGEALHPERYDLNALLKIQATQGGAASRHWSALYQQNPVPEEGAYFQKDSIIYRNQEPILEECNLYITWDFAISEKKVNDWTVGTVIAQDHTDTLHVLEQVRFKTNDAGVIAESIIALYKKYTQYHPAFGAEDGQIWRTVKALLLERMTTLKVYIPIDDEMNKLSPINDKLIRGRPLQARMRVRKVTFPRGEEWVDVFRKEALRFPGGVHDDTVDSLAWGVILTTRHGPPKAPQIKLNSRTEKTVKQILDEFAKGTTEGHMAA